MSLRIAIAAALVSSLVAIGCGADSPESSCPVTVAPTPAFEPPGRAAPHDPWAWFGTDDLWTLVGGSGRKSVWWSVHFPGGRLEPVPELTVVYERLVDGEVVQTWVEPDAATNAYTPQDGDFIIAGHEPDDPGCYRATGTYKGTSLTYVFEVPADEAAASEAASSRTGAAPIQRGG